MIASIEVVCDSVADTLAAQAAGAGRIELGSAPTLGGLTPSQGLVDAVLEVATVPVVVLVRPQPGGFVVDGATVSAMVSDIRWLSARGVAGVVVGALDTDGEVDIDACRRFRDAAEDIEFVFHRAFDRVADRDGALDAALELGVDRILTSGGAASALAGAGEIARLRERAAGAMEFLPAGGIRAANVGRVTVATGCRWVHAGPRCGVDSTVPGGEDSDFPGATRLDVDALAAMVDASTNTGRVD